MFNSSEAPAELKGFWVKVGQYISSRADIAPKIWLQKVCKLRSDCYPVREKALNMIDVPCAARDAPGCHAHEPADRSTGHCQG